MKKIYWLAFSLIIVFSACSKDESAGKIWSYRQAVMDSAYVFVGSETGGVKSDTTRIFAGTYFRSSLFENYVNASISFDDNQMTISQDRVKSEVYLYKFENDTLIILNPVDDAFLGYRRSDSVVIVQHYFYSKKADGTISMGQVDPVRNIDGEEVAKKSLFKSLQNMKSEKDTLLWCTRRSVFQ